VHGGGLRRNSIIEQARLCLLMRNGRGFGDVLIVALYAL
jgi:hypothetical protein